MLPTTLLSSNLALRLSYMHHLEELDAQTFPGERVRAPILGAPHLATATKVQTAGTGATAGGTTTQVNSLFLEYVSMLMGEF